MVLPFRLRFQTSVRHKPVRLPVRTPPCHPSGMIVHPIPLLFAIRTPKPNPQTHKQMPSNTNSTPSTFTTPLPTSRFPFFSSTLQVLPRLFSLSREFPDLRYIRIRSPSPPHPFHSPFFFFFFLSPRSLRQRRVLSRSALRRIHAPIPQSPPAALLLPRRTLLHVPRGRSALPVPRNRSRPRVHVRIFPFFSSIRSNFATLPVVPELLKACKKLYSADFYGYVNSDILLAPALFPVLDFVLDQYKQGLLTDGVSLAPRREA